MGLRALRVKFSQVNECVTSVNRITLNWYRRYWIKEHAKSLSKLIMTCNFCSHRLSKWIKLNILHLIHFSNCYIGATGCEVTKEAINQISASDIFTKQDHFLYPRVGLVSKFGTSKSVHDADGIWQTTKDNLKDAKKESSLAYHAACKVLSSDDWHFDFLEFEVQSLVAQNNSFHITRGQMSEFLNLSENLSIQPMAWAKFISDSKLNNWKTLHEGLRAL